MHIKGLGICTWPALGLLPDSGPPSYSLHPEMLLFALSQLCIPFQLWFWLLNFRVVIRPLICHGMWFLLVCWSLYLVAPDNSSLGHLATGTSVCLKPDQEANISTRFWPLWEDWPITSPTSKLSPAPGSEAMGHHIREIKEPLDS